MSDDLYDPYAAENQGGGGAPVISWKYSRPGETFTGVIVPPEPLTAPGKGYKMGREYQNGTDTDPDDQGFLVWPPKNNPQKIKRPVTEGKFAELWPDEPIPTGRGQVSRVEITLQTEYTQGEFFSDSMKKRFTEDGKDVKDETLRRVVRSGADLPGKIDEALKVIGAKAPEPGMRVTITLTEREENKGRQGTTSRYSVKIEPPNTASRAVVQAYLEKAQSTDAAAEYSAATSGSEEPPF